MYGCKHASTKEGMSKVTMVDQGNNGGEETKSVEMWVMIAGADRQGLSM